MGYRRVNEKKGEILENMIFEYLLIPEKEPLLCDEIYCQLIKQSKNNKNHKSCFIVWKLLYLLCLYKKPTQELLPFIMYHCLQNALPLTSNIMSLNQISHFAANCLKYLHQEVRDQVY